MAKAKPRSASGIQDRIFLKNGNGTVALDDYDEKIHGKAMELTDDEYRAMFADRFSGIPAAPSHPTTTIANLETPTAQGPRPVATVERKHSGGRGR